MPQPTECPPRLDRTVTEPAMEGGRMQVKVFTANGWVEVGPLEERINQFVAGKHVGSTRTELAVTTQTNNNQPVVVVTVWYD
jgi:hypothetical protein